MVTNEGSWGYRGNGYSRAGHQKQSERFSEKALLRVWGVHLATARSRAFSGSSKVCCASIPNFFFKISQNLAARTLLLGPSLARMCS